MVREQRLDVVDDLAAVGLEGVGRVVVAVPEQRPDAPVDERLIDQLQRAGSRVTAAPGMKREPKAQS